MTTTLDVRRELAATGHTSPTSLELPDGLRFNDWQRLGEQLEQHRNANLWWIADWAAYGDRYRRDYGDALKIFARKTLLNLSSISRQIESSRRREDLSFSHHVEVAPLDPEWQTAFLNDAAEKGWSVIELRAQITASRGRITTPALTIRLVDAARERALIEAERAQLDPAEYVARAIQWVADHGNPHLATELAAA